MRCSITEADPNDWYEAWNWDGTWGLLQSVINMLLDDWDGAWILKPSLYLMPILKIDIVLNDLYIARWLAQCLTIDTTNNDWYHLQWLITQMIIGSLFHNLY